MNEIFDYIDNQQILHNNKNLKKCMRIMRWDRVTHVDLGCWRRCYTI